MRSVASSAIGAGTADDIYTALHWFDTQFESEVNTSTNLHCKPTTNQAQSSKAARCRFTCKSDVPLEVTTPRTNHFSGNHRSCSARQTRCVLWTGGGRHVHPSSGEPRHFVPSLRAAGSFARSTRWNRSSKAAGTDPRGRAREGGLCWSAHLMPSVIPHLPTNFHLSKLKSGP